MKRWEILIQATLLRARMAMGRVHHNETPVVVAEDIMKQCKILTSDYIDDRLIRSGLNAKKRKVTRNTLSSIKESVPERKDVSLHTLRYGGW